MPWHFTAFHPDFRMLDTPPTPPATLARAREIARSKGLKHVYTGNLHDRVGSSTWCPSCGALLIERNGMSWAPNLDGNRCKACGCEIAGRFDPGRGAGGAAAGGRAWGDSPSFTRPAQGHASSAGVDRGRDRDARPQRLPDVIRARLHASRTNPPVQRSAVSSRYSHSNRWRPPFVQQHPGGSRQAATGRPGG